MANKGQIKAELESLNVAYDDDMTNAKLQALLDEATDAPGEQTETATKKAPAAQVKEVTLGLGTINDHEKRIFALENCLSGLIAEQLEKSLE